MIYVRVKYQFSLTGLEVGVTSQLKRKCHVS